MEEVAARLLEFKAALVRAGLSGEVSLILDRKDFWKLEQCATDTAFHGFSYGFSDEKRLCGEIVYVRERIDHALDVAKEVHTKQNELFWRSVDGGE